MGLPGLLPGGTTIDGSLSSQDSYYPSRGVFAQNPGATPKYALNKKGGARDAEYRETMARLFIEVSPKERQKFIDSCPKETQPLAKILCGGVGSASGGTGFVDFILTQAVESFQEKIQVTETLTDNFVVFCFGQQAPMFQYSGYLLNTYQDDQRVWMTRLYLDILRGTELARRRKLARLRYDSVIVSGIYVSQVQQIDATLENAVAFSFSFIPMQYVIFSPAYGKPTRLRTGFTPGADLGLGDIQAPNLKQMRFTTPTAPVAPSKKSQSQKDPMQESILPDFTPQQKLEERTKVQPSSQESSAWRGVDDFKGRV